MGHLGFVFLTSKCLVKTNIAHPRRGIGSNYLWIACHALADDRTLVTNNMREFERVAGLKLENWA
jgi:tRNA(fMet)-specific endonuclease VapC